MNSIVHPRGIFDNHARDYSHIKARPLAAAMGAEIVGVQVSDLTDAQFTEIRDALFHHKMIYFRDQDMNHADQEAFTARFGEFGTDAYTTGVSGHGNIQPVIREVDDGLDAIFGEGWHTDSSFLERPPAISLLRAVDVPPYGGDTIWSNTALAYRALSDGMRALIDGLRVHMSLQGVLDMTRDLENPYLKVKDGEMDEAMKEKVRGTYHPLVRTHPVTGEKSLFVDYTYSCGLEGMTRAEAAPLLNYLKAHVIDDYFKCRLKWEKGTFALWDNRLCMHRAFNDHQAFRREMYRTMVKGEKPA